MSGFSAYEKIPDNLKKLKLDNNDFSEMEKLKWVVTEKVHGANFSFIYKDGNLKYAKRKEYLSWRDDFFGFQLVVNKIEDNIIRLFEDLSSQEPGNKYIIYGELFGGMYPHPDVKADENIQAIQTGVYYSPSVNFCAFDIAVEVNNLAAKYYLDYETSLSYFEKHEIFHGKPLFVGKFGDAINFGTRINSRIPQQLYLPELNENLIEGVVIKPFSQFNNNKALRPIVKLKNAEFEEKKFHKAEKWSYIPNISSNNEDLHFILEDLTNYITLNRLRSSVSKIGSLDFDNQQRISEIETEFLKDTLADFNENNDNFLEDLSADQKKWLSERVIFKIKKVIFSNQI